MCYSYHDEQRTIQNSTGKSYWYQSKAIIHFEIIEAITRTMAHDTYAATRPIATIGTKLNVRLARKGE